MKNGDKRGLTAHRAKRFSPLANHIKTPSFNDQSRFIPNLGEKRTPLEVGRKYWTSRVRQDRLGGPIGTGRPDWLENAREGELTGPSGSDGFSKLARVLQALERLLRAARKTKPLRKERWSWWLCAVAPDPGRSLSVAGGGSPIEGVRVCSRQREAVGGRVMRVEFKGVGSWELGGLLRAEEEEEEAEGRSGMAGYACGQKRQRKKRKKKRECISGGDNSVCRLAELRNEKKRRKELCNLHDMIGLSGSLGNLMISTITAGLVRVRDYLAKRWDPMMVGDIVSSTPAIEVTDVFIRGPRRPR
ncbi:hypothetical protein CRG98_017016 [Punica granatum]|uniref:Uncharacterized protein n=1 Tax=Punica granatum TaxID=22663 RepID=A0A2I0K216_PUNGR|nr:hypothetical protein CRG98_017016 [Punica granatum]